VYEVSYLEEKKPKKFKQLAFVVDQERFVIYIGHSGHLTLLKYRDRHDFEGGWIFIKSRKVTPYSGSLGKITQNFDEILSSLEKCLQIPLRKI